MSGDWERGKDISLFCGSIALSVGDGYHMMLERGTKNFEVDNLFIWQPAQIRILAQLRLAITSLCRHCLLQDEILRAPNNSHKASAFRRTVQPFRQSNGK